MVKDNISGEFPKDTSTAYKSGEIRTLTKNDHFVNSINSQLNVNENNRTEYYVIDKNLHFTRDVNDPNLKDKPVLNKSSILSDSGNFIEKQVPVFSGSTTNINPYNDKDKQDIIDNTLSETEQTRYRDSNNSVPPVSPIHPSTRLDPKLARSSNLTTYNRIKTPIADLEFRKGFRHMFFTRPECYVMCNDNGIRLCEQTTFDEDFSSSYSRMPHIMAMLAPFYITGSFSNDGLNSNWNYLLSNRSTGFSPQGHTMSTIENTSKSIEGYSILPAGFVESLQGGTFEMDFNETKTLECYEFLRMWMLYAYKRHKGIFSPAYNGYMYQNKFYNIRLDDNGGMKIYDNHLLLHPYDRAIDYACSFFDIVTNESMTKIIYWCKYYGVFPTATALSMSNENNSPITNVKCSATFRYAYKCECVNKSLLEFNFNAGIVDKMGKPTKEVEYSIPYLVRDDVNNKVLPQYIGAAGMFTGSPYIVMGIDNMPNPLTNEQDVVSPYLRFANLTDKKYNSYINQGIVNPSNSGSNNPIHL